MTLKHHMTTFIHDLGIDQLDTEAQQEIMASVVDSLDSRVGIRLSELLTPEQMTSVLAAAKESEDAEEAEVRKYVPHYDDLIVEELQAVKEEMQELLPK